MEAGVRSDGVRGQKPKCPTFLHVAAENSHVEVTQSLLNAGADIRALASKGRSPLHVSAMNGRIEVMSTLIEAGADLDAQDSKGLVPLHLAAWHGHINAARLGVGHLSGIVPGNCVIC